MARNLERTQDGVNDRNDEVNQEIQEFSAGVGEVHRFVAHVRVAVPGLRIIWRALDRVGRAETAKTIDVEAGQAAVIEASDGVVAQERLRSHPNLFFRSSLLEQLSDVLVSSRDRQAERSAALGVSSVHIRTMGQQLSYDIRSPVH